MSNNITLGEKEYFKGIGKIPFEGPDSQNPLTFKYYDENQLVAGKTMRDHFRFSVAYWHTFRGTGVLCLQTAFKNTQRQRTD